MPEIKFGFSTTLSGSVDFTKPITVTDANGVIHTLVEKVITPPPPPDPPPSIDPTPTGTAEYWKGDAETGDLSQWSKVVQAAPDRIQVITSPVSQGKYAYRFELRDGDDASGERVQLDSGISGGPNSHYISDGDEAFYGVSFYLPSASLPKIAKWRLFLQFKGIHTGSPPVAISHNADEWRLYYRPNTSSDNLLKWRTPDRKDVWEKFMFRIKWSKDPQVGFIEMYYNGVLAVPKFYTSNIHVQGGVPIRNIVDIGIYRDAGITSTDVIYIDNFVAGRSYDEVKQ